ncbi:MAG: hypothetical protein CR984_07640 [Proteobacteria bacterium]|nr:MAG: hypothetical protein CR984_07640 [Pseudomonadota bacterium]
MTPRKKRILLVDDEEKLVQSISRRLTVLGFEPYTATSGMVAVAIARQRPVDLAIVDFQMPEMDGLVTITKLKEIQPGLKTVLLTGHGNEKVRQATESLNTIYFEKDEMGDFWRFIKALSTGGNVVVIRPPGPADATDNAAGGLSPNTIEIHAPGRYPAGGDKPLSAVGKAMQADDLSPLRIVGETAAMQDLRKAIDRLAPLGFTIMLSGEDGTGKELAAKAIHARSTHRRQRFLAIGCGDLGNAQFVRQLLGNETGDLCEALLSRRGIFGGDPVGSLFLDRVEALPRPMQAQLLNAIDRIDLARADAERTGSLDVRILVAAESNLARLVENGCFDADLYDRLIFFNLAIPPLRARKDDIPPLCSFFLKKYGEDLNKPIEKIAPEVIEIFLNYRFPGNVRELAHIIERAVIMAGGDTIEREHLPVRFLETSAEAGVPSNENFVTLAELGKRYIVNVLKACGGNKSKTAEILGISRAALWRKLKQLKDAQAGQ